MINHRRIGSISNVHAGSDFETIAATYFWQLEGQALQPRFAIQLGVGATKKPHRFDLGSEDPAILVECKSHTWTEKGSIPSAKLTVWNEAMYLLPGPTPFAIRSEIRSMSRARATGSS